MIRRIFTEEEVFDLELKAHGQVQYDLGRSDERERIIALIESSKVGGHRDAEYLVALIKGENE
jgi:hypothetical protein